MNLVDDEHLILAHLRRYARLLHQSLYILHRVVARGIKLEDIVRTAFIESLATLALVARLTLSRRVLAVDGLGEYARTGGLAHSARTAEQVSMRQLAALDGVLQRRGESLLPHHRVARARAVLARRNDIFFHSTCKGRQI